jgi:putative DNA primase/helicase
MKFDYNNIPSELKALKNWVVYRLEERINSAGERNITKVPFHPTRCTRAKSNDPTTWSAFDPCVAAVSTGEFHGIGFMFSGTGYVGIDLDHVQDSESGIATWAHSIIERLNSYAETSQSGEGVHIIAKGTLPPGRHRKGQVEMYDGTSPRYFAMTGFHLMNTPSTIEERTADLASIHADFVADVAEPSNFSNALGAGAPNLDDAEVILRARSAANGNKFAALYDRGDWKGFGYASQSEADAALCRMLAFWTGNDAARVDSLFKSSALMRPKWERNDYRSSTINHAIKGETYSPPVDPPKEFDIAKFMPPGEIILPGQRHNVLRGIAIRLGKLGYEYGRIVETLLETNGRLASPPLNADEVREKVAPWALRSPYTDVGNSQFFALKYGQNVLWAAAEDQWISWDGRRWADSGKSGTGLLAHLAVGDLHHEAEGLPEKEANQSAKWALRSSSRARMESMTSLAKGLLTVEPDEFDCDQFLLNVANGVLDLRTGRLREPRREDMIRLSSPVQFDPEANCPRWLQFIKEVFEPCPDLVTFVQKAAGYSLAGATREHCFFFLQGKGANGKSTLVAVLQELMGDYGGPCARSLLLAKQAGAQTNDVASLRGKRLVVSQELKEGDKLDEPAIKSLTSGDRQSVRGLYKEFFEMDPRFKIWVTSNPPPEIAGTDDGIWRRLRLIPFHVSFKGREDLGLMDALLAKLPGILNWAIEGCLLWQAEGLGKAASVTQATEELREDSDDVRKYVAERCTIHESLRVRANAIYADYKSWAGERGDQQLSSSKFGRRLVAIDGVSKLKTGGLVYVGIGLRAPGRQEEDDDAS